MNNFLLIILFAFCIYLWIQNDQLKRQTPNRNKIRSTPASSSSEPSPVERDTTINNRSEPNIPIEPQRREQRSSRHPTFNTGIPELDGPGIWHRLNQYPSGHALYLLYSRSHEAYKVGVSEPARLAHRIRMVREEVPDAVLNGLAVFTSRQNAFDREQEVLTRYRNNQYLGIRGRYSGGSEWISVRPIGRPYFTTPERIEEMFRESIEAPTQELVIPDIYTVYLLYSRSKNMYKCSWCNTNNLWAKIRRTQINEAADAQLVSRFRVETRVIARAITISNNEMAGSFRREGRNEIYEWCEEPEYLSSFDNWDANGQRK